MDSASSSSSNSTAKKHKSSDEGHTNNINDLPVEIVEHILSFLGTKEAVRTSILSKKWQYLWTSIPNLQFVEENSSRTLFMNSVERALLLHNSSVINKFSISCDVLSDASRINTWVSAALRRKLKYLSVHLNVDDDDETSFVLPREVFTCGTLTELFIRMFCSLRLPSEITLPSLTTLVLTGVVLKDECLTQQLFSLPSLEELTLSECDWSNLGSVSICALNLKKLAIHEMVDAVSDVDCHVMIFGTNLTHFTLEGEFINHYCLCNSSSLLVADILVRDEGLRSRCIAYRFYQLVGGLCTTVESLNLEGAVEVLNVGAVELIPYIPMFINLTILELDTCGFGTEVDSRAFLSIVSSCPHLQSLQFTSVSVSSSCQLDNWNLDPVPPCFKSCLKTIGISDFFGSAKELGAVSILLMNVKFLEEMTICCYLDIIIKSRDEERKVREQLLQFPRLSKTCKLILS